MQEIKNLLTRLNQENDFFKKYPEYRPDDGKIHVLFLAPYANGVGLYRTILPYLHLNETETHAAIISGFHSWDHSNQLNSEQQEHADDRLFKWAHYVVMPTVVSDLRAMMMEMLKKNPKLKFAMDIDDNYHELYHQHPQYNSFTRAMKDNLVRNLSVCEFFTTTNDLLANYYLDKISNAYPASVTEAAVIPNLMSEYLVGKTILDKPVFDKIRIGMVVQQNHFVNVNAFRNVLKDISNAYRGKIELINMGWNGKYKMKDAFKGIPITCMPPVPFINYFDALQSLCFDIALIPLKNEPNFNRFKSPQRWLEFTLTGTPVIVGDCEVYADIIKASLDETVGLVAENIYEWLNGIELLIGQEEARRNMVVNAQKFVSENLTWKKGNEHVNNLQQIFN